MARSDLLVTLVRAGAQGDQGLFRRTVEALVVDEREKQHHVLAERLSSYLESKSHSPIQFRGPAEHTASSLYAEVVPRKRFEDLKLSMLVQRACREIIEEQERVELLRAHNLEPRNRILLAGPPGNGKTSLAEAMAHSLAVPLIQVRYEGIVASFLGETAIRMARLFESVRSRKCVLFFDEFDAIAKERGDTHETGEVKRVVSSLLLQVDALPSHVLVVVASNHPELLDRAVWRRFQIRLNIPLPTSQELSDFIGQFFSRAKLELPVSSREIGRRLRGASYAEAEELCMDVSRRILLDGPSSRPREVVERRLEMWDERVRPLNFDQ